MKAFYWVAQKMGCVSSKIITKSASFRDEWNRLSFQRKGNGLDEIIISKNGGDQFVALLCAADTVARKLKEGPPKHDRNVYTNSNTEGTETDDTDIETSVSTEETERNDADIETINTWELLAGLEEGNETVAATSDNSIILSDSTSLSKSFRTVEDFDAMIAANQSSEGSEISSKVEEDRIDCKVEKLEEKHEKISEQVNAKEGDTLQGNLTTGKGFRRKAMAKDLAVLNVPAFEFSKADSLRDWILLGGQVFSPGSYVTPKFGKFVSRGAKDGDNTDAFHPELVAQFEQAMEELTMEEDCILEKITEGIEDC